MDIDEALEGYNKIWDNVDISEDDDDIYYEIIEDE
jgi:hypothetical protein